VSAGKLAKASLEVYDSYGSYNITSICAECRRLKEYSLVKESDLGLVIIDYLQLMHGATEARAKSRMRKVCEILYLLKELAEEINVPVVIASQISRPAEVCKDHRPTLRDLRKSGVDEAYADVVAFLDRDEYYNPETEKKNRAEVIIAKNRYGSTGTVELAFHRTVSRFADVMPN
jgi:replicative DNA helicase